MTKLENHPNSEVGAIEVTSMVLKTLMDFVRAMFNAEGTNLPVLKSTEAITRILQHCCKSRV